MQDMGIVQRLFVDKKFFMRVQSHSLEVLCGVESGVTKLILKSKQGNLVVTETSCWFQDPKPTLHAGCSCSQGFLYDIKFGKQRRTCFPKYSQDRIILRRQELLSSSSARSFSCLEEEGSLQLSSSNAESSSYFSSSSVISKHLRWSWLFHHLLWNHHRHRGSLTKRDTKRIKRHPSDKSD